MRRSILKTPVLKRGLVFVLMFLLCSSPALASFDTGDIVIKKAKAYSDKAMTQYIGTIPAYTALTVEFYDPEDWSVYYQKDVAHVQYNGVACYIKTSALWNDNYEFKSYVTLPKNTKVYQRPSKTSPSTKIKKSVRVIGCLKVGKWGLVRTDDTDYNGRYSYIYLG